MLKILVRTFEKLKTSVKAAFKTADSFPGIPALLFGAFILFYGYFAIHFGSPIIGSDEYAYFIFGKFLNHRAELLALDPHLQTLSNIIYFSIIHILIKIGFPDPTLAARLLHIFEYGAAAFLTFKIFSRICERRFLLLGLAGALILPHACYSLVLMPEIELVLASAAIAYLVIVVFPSRPTFAVLLTGLVLGMALLIKPHAVALLGAAILTIGIASFLRIGSSPKKSATVWLLALLLVTSYLSAVICWRLGTREWVLNPLNFLGLNYYGKYLNQTGVSHNAFWKIANTLMYACTHLTILLLIFSPALVGLAVSFINLFNRSRQKKPETFAPSEKDAPMAVLFAVAMLVCHILMIAYFTVGASLLSGDEAMRLHGRYLGPVIIFLPFFYFYYVQKHNDAFLKYLLPALSGAVLLSQFVIFPSFKLFPWDYPVLFAFFTSPNHFNWDFHGHTNLGHWIMLCALLSLFWLGFAKKNAKFVLSALLFIFLAAGLYQTLNWMRVHSKARQELSRYPKAFASLLSDQTMGRGIFVSSERDLATYVLYGLANSPKVFQRQPKSSITKEDVVGSDWVLLREEYSVDFNYVQMIEAGTFKFYSLQPGVFTAPKKETP